MTLFFDFGGCIDAPGIHTRTLFWYACLAEGMQQLAQRAAFQDAYTKADQRMMKTGEAKSLALAEFNRHNAKLICEELGIAGAEKIGDRVTEQMRGYLADSRAALEKLHGKFELGIISNFTGNLEVILHELLLRELFASVTESYYAGASKPDERIFLEALGDRRPADCLYIGDNPVNDIAPAKKLGMKAVLIHPKGARKECGADYYVEDLAAFASWIQNK